MRSKRKGTPRSSRRRTLTGLAAAASVAALSLGAVPTGNAATTGSGDNQDLNGDGHTDLVIEGGAHGTLTEYPGSGTAANGGFAGNPFTIGTGFDTFASIYPVLGYPSQNAESILAMTYTGQLRLYPTGANHQPQGTGQVIGNGFNTYRTLVPVDDFTGRGRPDLLGINDQGDMYLYEYTGSGWVTPTGVRIGTGWNSVLDAYPLRWTTGSTIGVVATEPDGTLRYYQGNGTGGWSNGAGLQIGTGFSTDDSLISPGDWTGDGVDDLMLRDTTGDLYLYSPTGTGTWQNNGHPTRIGSGFTADYPLGDGLS